MGLYGKIYNPIKDEINISGLKALVLTNKIRLNEVKESDSNIGNFSECQ